MAIRYSLPNARGSRFRSGRRERLPREAVPPGLRTRIEASAGMRHARAIPLDALAASIAAHVRSLVLPQPTDVIASTATSSNFGSTDAFRRRRGLLISPRRDSRCGGCLDVDHRTPVPGLAYHYHSHLISLTAVPASGYANSAAVLRSVMGKRAPSDRGRSRVLGTRRYRSCGPRKLRLAVPHDTA
jgi:hypothetical protein